MRASELLLAFAKYLENSNNEIISLAEENDEHLLKVSIACVEAAEILKETAHEIAPEEYEESNLTFDSLDSLSAIASMFDSTGDEELKKQASVIDELIANFVVNSDGVSALKKSEAMKIEKMKALYNQKNSFDPKKAEIKKAFDDSPKTKQYRPLEAPLSTRHCPDHPGTSLIRLEDHVWQCSLDKKIYDFDAGFTTLNGNKVPGGGVEYQTGGDRPVFENSFSTRETHKK